MHVRGVNWRAWLWASPDTSHPVFPWTTILSFDFVVLRAVSLSNKMPSFRCLSTRFPARFWTTCRSSFCHSDMRSTNRFWIMPEPLISSGMRVRHPCSGYKIGLGLALREGWVDTSPETWIDRWSLDPQGLSCHLKLEPTMIDNVDTALWSMSVINGNRDHTVHAASQVSKIPLPNRKKQTATLGTKLVREISTWMWPTYKLYSMWLGSWVQTKQEVQSRVVSLANKQ